MNNQTIKCCHTSYLRFICLLMAICSLFFTTMVFAKKYQLQLIVDVSEFSENSDQALWLEPQSNPINNNEFFVAQDNGLIYLIGTDAKNTQKTILNFRTELKNSSFISLTAMALHPNFTKAEKPGYATLFTSHTTAFENKTNNNRLVLDKTNIEFEFETVITAWQYDFDRQKIAAETQREVLRIPIKNQDKAIQNLTFDPYQKPWNKEYGQLYFSLSHADELKQHSLYSGVILRIVPLMFGARNYTVPPTNPFIKEPLINDEIVIMGGQNIERFFWSKNQHRSIFIQHNNNQQHWLSKTTLGENFITQTQANFLWQQPTAMSSMLLYQGRDFLHLRNKMVFFTLIDNQWHLSSQGLEPLSDETPLLEEMHPQDDLPPSSSLSIHQNNKNEIILFDQLGSRMYSLQVITPPEAETNTQEPNETEDDTNHFVFYLILFAAVALLSIFVYRKKEAQKSSVQLLDKHHFLLKYEASTQQLLLFKPNKKYFHKELILDDIIGCEVMLNNRVINIIDAQPENAFSNSIEANIRAIFNQEKSQNMHSGNVRHVSIKLADKNDSYTACLYLRKGKVRVTGKKYHAVIDILLDLCWSISKHLCPQATEKRLIPLVAFSRPKVSQSAQPVAKSQPSQQNNIDQSSKAPTSRKISEAKPSEPVMEQTNMLDALDKLVHLHQQGHLSDEEFSLAKSKILQKL